MSDEELEIKDGDAVDIDDEDTDFDLDDGLLDFGEDEDLSDEAAMSAYGFSFDDSKESEE